MKIAGIAACVPKNKVQNSCAYEKFTQFEVDRVIPGWTEALLAMKVGDKWKVFIPAELAYGERGNGPIPPNAVLVFEVELLEIVE